MTLFHISLLSLQLITSPSEENSMYVQQRDEYLESVCEMAIRKVSIITIFGSLTNSTMKIDHYQLGELLPRAVDAAVQCLPM